MATNQLLQLEEIQMDYHAFRPDQVLTDKHLNELIHFFEDQDRITRTCLTGVGIVCGLGVAFSSSEPLVVLSKGCGITTDGDLLVVDQKSYRHFKPYSNKKKGTDDPIYDPFFPLPAGTQMPLWELISPDSSGNLPQDSISLANFKTTSGGVLDDMVALLYLEYYLQDPDKCSVVNCDNQGPHQQSSIKLLLLSKEDMEKVINRDPVNEVIADSIYKKYHDSSSQYFTLPVLKAKRVILSSFNTGTVTALSKAYTGIVQTEGNKLVDAIDKLYTTYKFIIDSPGSTNLLNLKQSLQQHLSQSQQIYHAQYVYDYYKDIINCYNELRDLLFRSMSECCPDKYAFPKHLMLGELKLINALSPDYRHDFYPSPAVSEGKEKLARCRMMWVRMQQLIQQFSIPGLDGTVKVTPSTDYDRLLENRAIPFYYSEVKNIVKNWNYILSRKGAEKSILCYNAGDYAAGIDSTINPLDYSIDENNFFRIEGHLGKTINQALQAVDAVKNNKSLPFDCVAIRIDKDGDLNSINPDDFDCQFEDLNAVLKAWIVEQNCLYASTTKFFTGFSTKKENGFHVKIDDFKPKAVNFITANARLAANVVTPISGIRFNQPAAAAIANSNILTLDPDRGASKVPICKTIYTVDKTVLDNLEVSKAEALGTPFVEALSLRLNTADDVIAEVKRRTASDPNLATLTADEKAVVYDTPIMLVAHLNAISAIKPYSVDEINTDLIEKFIERSEAMCKYVRTLHTNIESIFSNAVYVKRGYETYYIYLLQQLIANCCAGERLETMLNEIENRKKKILESLQLTNYAGQHPGLEHKAGVHRGGTFVLVYAKQVKGTTRPDLQLNVNAALRDSLLALPFALNISASEALIDKAGGTSLSVYKDLDSFAYYIVTNQGTINFDLEVDRFMKVQGIKPGTVEEQAMTKRLAARIKEICSRLNRDDEAAVADNVVVADFCLPYLCCSDCPPMVFIMPKQNFTLSLPKAVACSDEPQLEFHKEPQEGTVTAIAGFENTVTNVNGRSFFDPSKVPAASFGKEISFLIDGQVTDCRISVFKHPNAAFEFKVTDESAASITVLYTNFSDDQTGTAYTYEWNFSDGRPPQRVANKEPITITYKKQLLEQLGLTGTIPVTLLAMNGGCKSEVITQQVPYVRDQPVSLRLPVSVICDDAQPVSFMALQPQDGVITSPEEPDSVIPGNAPQFDPTKVKTVGKLITFMVNGKPTNCTVTVLKHPVASFKEEHKIEQGGQIIRVLLSNTSDPQNNLQLGYTWKYNDGRVKTMPDTAPFEETFSVPVLRQLNQTKVIISLTAANKACSHTVSVEIDLPAVEKTCPDIVADDTQKSIDALSSNEFKTLMAKLDASGVEPQFKQVIKIVDATVDLLTQTKKNAVSLSSNIALQTAIVNQTSAMLDTLYRNQFGKETNDQVITVIVNALLKLAFDATRCSNVLPPQVKETLGAILRNFKEFSQSLAERMPKLNTGDNLVAAGKDYGKNAQHKDQDVLKLLQDVLKLISALFKS